VPLRDTDSIDIVSKPFPSDDCKLLLFVTDDGSVTDEIERYQLLTAKLSSYVRYVTDDEFLASHPGVRPADVVIRVICVRPANAAMLEVQAVAPRGEGNDATRRVRVEHFGQAEFQARLEAGWAEPGAAADRGNGVDLPGR
jgi:hypothetical protein